jgi:PPOX class probable F420-dependent enzyme
MRGKEHMHVTAIDYTTGVGPRIQELLRDELVIWLTTTSSDSTPQPRLVWFVWDDDSVLTYSQSGTPKLAHIARNPRVSLNFNSDRHGSPMSVMTGTATIDDAAPRAVDNAPYIEKYRGDLAGLHMTPEQFSAEYSVAVRIQPTKIRGF